MPQSVAGLLLISPDETVVGIAAFVSGPGSPDEIVVGIAAFGSGIVSREERVVVLLRSFADY